MEKEKKLSFVFIKIRNIMVLFMIIIKKENISKHEGKEEKFNGNGAYFR